MNAKDPIWASVKRDYLAGKWDTKELSGRYGVPQNSISRRARRWTFERQQLESEIIHEIKTRYCDDLDRQTRTLLEHWGQAMFEASRYLERAQKGEKLPLHELEAASRVLDTATKNLRLLKGETTSKQVLQVVSNLPVPGALPLAKPPESRFEHLFPHEGSPLAPVETPA